MNSVIGTIKKRRSRYALENKITISDAELKGLIEEIVEEMPTQMNSQSSRLVVLLGKDHDRLWDITLEELKKVTTEDQYEGTHAKVNGAGKIDFFPFNELQVLAFAFSTLHGVAVLPLL